MTTLSLEVLPPNAFSVLSKLCFFICVCTRYGTVLGPYGLSKALLNASTVALAREHPSLKVNACSPGMINTDLVNDFVPWFVPKFLARFVFKYVVMAKTPDQGTVAPCHLLFGDLQGNGRYYGSDAKRSPLDVPRDPGTPEYTGSE